MTVDAVEHDEGLASVGSPVQVVQSGPIDLYEFVFKGLFRNVLVLDFPDGLKQ